jgi:hypothetical protein
MNNEVCIDCSVTRQRGWMDGGSNPSRGDIFICSLKHTVGHIQCVPGGANQPGQISDHSRPSSAKVEDE